MLPYMEKYIVLNEIVPRFII